MAISVRKKWTISSLRLDLDGTLQVLDLHDAWAGARWAVEADPGAVDRRGAATLEVRRGGKAASLYENY